MFEWFKNKQKEQETQQFRQMQQENAKIKALKSQIQMLEQLLSDSNSRLIQMSKQVNHQQKANMEEKITETILNLFAPQGMGNNSGSGQTNLDNFDPVVTYPKELMLESGKQISEEEIRTRFKGFNKSQLRALQGLAPDSFYQQAQKYAPGISKESALLAQEIAGQMANGQ